MAAAEARAVCGEGEVRIELPGDGVVLCGDLRLDLHATGLFPEQLLWLHAHTGCMPRDARTGSDPRRAGAGHVCAASYCKHEVDLAAADSRFPADWTCTIHYYRDA